MSVGSCCCGTSHDGPSFPAFTQVPKKTCQKWPCGEGLGHLAVSEVGDPENERHVGSHSCVTPCDSTRCYHLLADWSYVLSARLYADVLPRLESMSASLVPDPCGLPQRLEPHDQMKILDSSLLAVITEAKHGQQFQLSRVPAASVPTCDKLWPLQCH